VNGRILVTGGAGFIGSHLVDELVGRGEAVSVLDDFSTGRNENLREAQGRGDVRIVQGSMLDPEALNEAIGGCDRVFHLAVQCVRRSLSKPLENHEINATGTLRVLETARRKKLRRFIYCSSSEVYGDAGADLLNERTTSCEPITVYGAAKLAGEHYTRAYSRTYGVPGLVVRPFNAYGPREHDRGDLAEVIPRFVIRVLNGLPPVIFGDGKNARDFTYVTDVARGLAMAAECDGLLGRVVNIACGRAITIEQVAQIVLRLCQRTDLKPLMLPARPGDVHFLHADTALAARVLGFRATISFEEGLERYLDWFNRTHSDPSELLEERILNWQMPSDES
jgi:UDP-glucose 4-epimerase